MTSLGWTTALISDIGKIHDQLVSALRRDVGSGALPSGTPMPAHRDLAGRLGIGVGTVTKARATSPEASSRRR